MRVEIMGCGSGGSYLYRLLEQRKREVAVGLFDMRPDTVCGIKSCGWGVSSTALAALCREVAVNACQVVRRPAANQIMAAITITPAMIPPISHQGGLT